MLNAVSGNGQWIQQEFDMCMEDSVRILAKTFVLISIALGHWAHPAWLLLTAFVGVNLIQSAITGFCPACIALKRCGLKPRHSANKGTEGDGLS